MNMPPEIDMLILSFLGIKPHWRCKSYNNKNLICRKRTKKHQFFCSQHNKIIETQIANLPKIFNTIIIIYSHLWRKKFGSNQHRDTGYCFRREEEWRYDDNHWCDQCGVGFFLHEVCYCQHLCV